MSPAGSGGAARVRRATLTVAFKRLKAYQLGDGSLALDKDVAWAEAAEFARCQCGREVSAASAALLRIPVDDPHGRSTQKRLKLAYKLLDHGLLHPALTTVLPTVTRIPNSAWGLLCVVRDLTAPTELLVRGWTATLRAEQGHSIPLAVALDPLVHADAAAVPFDAIERVLAALGRDGWRTESVETSQGADTTVTPPAHRYRLVRVGSGELTPGTGGRLF